MKKTWPAAVVALAALVACTITGGCGSPESTAIAIGGGGEMKVADGTLGIDHVGIVQWGDMFRVAARLKNNSEQLTVAQSVYSATVYDSVSVVLGNDTAPLAPLYPGEERWCVSAAMRTGVTTPTRADFRVVGMDWKEVPPDDVPPMQLIQANYITTTPTDAKVTGIIRYSGPQRRVKVGLSGVLLSARNDPLEATTTIIENVPAGDYPYEMPFLRTGSEPLPFHRIQVTPYLIPIEAPN